MNRTGIFLAAAALLALVAVVAGLPRLGPVAVPTTVVTPPIISPIAPVPVPTVQDGSLSMVARLSHPFITVGRQDVFVTVELTGANVENAVRTPVNLAMVIDRSGSMSGPKLNQAKQAARQLVSQLRSTDRLTIVHYGSDVQSLDGLVATEENKAKLLAYIDGIYDDGGTNTSSALSTARDLLAKAKSDYKVNRLILVSDGQPTEGITDTDGLLGIVREVRSLGISVSSLGVGDDFNESLMSAIAEVGAGAYGYLQDASQLSTIFQKDLNAAGTQVARGVSLTFKVPQGARFERVLGYSQVTRSSQGGQDFISVAMPDFSAGQQERLVAHLTVDGVVDGQSVDVSDLELSYGDLLKNSQVKSGARLSAMTTGSADVVTKSRDKDAVVFAARARAAANSQQAAQELSQGNRQAAEQLLQQNQVIFDDASSAAGAPAVAADLQQQAAQLKGLRDAKSDDDRRLYKKSINSESRKNFGLMGSTY